MSRGDFLVLMLADSAVPTGGFVASSGLEAAVKTGLVKNVRQLSAFIDRTLENLFVSVVPCITRLLDQLMDCKEEHSVGNHSYEQTILSTFARLSVEFDTFMSEFPWPSYQRNLKQNAMLLLRKHPWLKEVPLLP